MGARPDDLRHVDVPRRPPLHRVHPQPVHDQRRPLLRHHEAVRVRPQADPGAHGAHDPRRMGPLGAHQHPAAVRMEVTPAARTLRTQPG